MILHRFGICGIGSSLGLGLRLGGVIGRRVRGRRHDGVGIFCGEGCCHVGRDRERKRLLLLLLSRFEQAGNNSIVYNDVYSDKLAVVDWWEADRRPEVCVSVWVQCLMLFGKSQSKQLQVGKSTRQSPIVHAAQAAQAMPAQYS